MLPIEVSRFQRQRVKGSVLGIANVAQAPSDALALGKPPFHQGLQLCNALLGQCIKRWPILADAVRECLSVAVLPIEELHGWLLGDASP